MVHVVIIWVGITRGVTYLQMGSFSLLSPFCPPLQRSAGVVGPLGGCEAMCLVIRTLQLRLFSGKVHAILLGICDSNLSHASLLSYSLAYLRLLW